MDNQKSEAWDKAKLEEWEKFWNSEMGQEAQKKMKQIKEGLINESMTQAAPEAVAAYVGRAAGIEMILEDIKGGFEALKKMKEEEEKGSKAKK